MSGLGDMGNLLKQAQEMQRQVKQVKSELRSATIEGKAGGEAVVVEVTQDRHEVKRVSITPEVLASGDATLIEDMCLGAFQDALRRAEEAEASAIGRVTGGMQLPGLF